MHLQLSSSEAAFQRVEWGEEKTKTAKSIVWHGGGNTTQNTAAFFFKTVHSSLIKTACEYLSLSESHLSKAQMEAHWFYEVFPSRWREALHLSPESRGISSLTVTERRTIQFLHTRLRKWQLHPSNRSGQKASGLLSVFHTPHPICPKIQLALPSVSRI